MPPERSTFRLFGVTHTGRRPTNQDSLCVGTVPGSGGAIAYAAVADGVGGQPDGAEASAVAVETIERRLGSLDPAKPQTFERAFLGAVSEANRQVLELARAHVDGCKPSTTIVCALAWGERAIVASMGDSRLYVVAEGEIKLVTRDHTRIAEAIRSGVPAEKLTSLRDALNRFLGRDPQAHGDLVRLDLRRDAVLVLTTDGVSGSIRRPFLSEADILKEVLSHRTVDDACRNLLRIAHERGSRDNITAAAIEKGTVPREGPAELRPPLPGESVFLAGE